MSSSSPSPCRHPILLLLLLVVAAAFFSAEYAAAAGIWTTLDLQGDTLPLCFDCICYARFSAGEAGLLCMQCSALSRLEVPTPLNYPQLVDYIQTQFFLPSYQT